MTFAFDFLSCAVLKACQSPSDVELQKYRRVKLNNPKIQSTIVQVDGTMELLVVSAH